MVIYNSRQYPMNPKAKSLWIELMLTTYKDRQCIGRACYKPYESTDYHYCGIGLLQVAYALAHGLDHDAYSIHPTINTMPNEIFEWAGLNSRDGLYKLPDGYTTTLVCNNDSGVPFPELANIIQENF